jgi:hypothetical protein
LWRANPAAASRTDAAPELQVRAGDRLAVDRDPAGRGGIEAGEEAEQRRLARSVGPEHRQPLAGPEVELVDRQHLTPATALADGAQGYDCAHAAARCRTDVSTALIVKASASRIAA